jgi:hypothetical protein
LFIGCPRRCPSKAGIIAGRRGVSTCETTRHAQRVESGGGDRRSRADKATARRDFAVLPGLAGSDLPGVGVLVTVVL